MGYLNYEAALIEGKYIHTILSLIHTLADITLVFENLVQLRRIEPQDVNALKQKN